MINILNKSEKHGNLSDCNGISYFTEIAPRLRQYFQNFAKLEKSGASDSSQIYYRCQTYMANLILKNLL